MQAVLDRIRARAYEALVLTFSIASVVEALAAQQVDNRALVALLALGWSLPFAFRPRWPRLAGAISGANTADSTISTMTASAIMATGSRVRRSTTLAQKPRLALIGIGAR